ncbi:DUF4386 domain-containing protein [Nannocystis sp. SCPEA4]|uniref:DUF4386 domain-containing protein n=1 Tax=Nannocystis sp. SCPEA4 TaxID=2996787 RepID=UPI00226F7264|nr:DUF4386 domain-containing protein [Nannocystis sp. SCPEA4]MCY1063026.1 DUF4386 domain-containing protein [Nannocystis sp. SCPEA4]
MNPSLAGRIAGALFLAAFLFYGGGMALSDKTIGVLLILANSVAVTAIGVLFFGPLRPAAPRTARAYLAARVAEGTLLAVGVAFLAGGNPEVNSYLYAAAMVLLAAGSIPMCLTLGRLRWIPQWLAIWGAVGYGLLAVGTVLGFAAPDAALVLAAPGGLFEITFGVFLLRMGLPSRGPTPAMNAAE